MSKNLIKLEDIAWGVEPKIEDERFIPICSTKPKCPCYLWAVCDRAITVPTHYLYGRTVPCVGLANNCEGCGAKRQVRVKSYIGSFEPVFSRLVLAEVTSEALVHCEVNLIHPHRPLRGWWIKLHRIGEKCNGTVRVEVSDKKAAPELPEPFDERRALVRIWNGANRPK